MCRRKSITSPPLTLRRSPRFQPTTPKPTSRTYPNSSSPNNLREKSVTKAAKDAILRSGLRRSPRLNSLVGVSQPLRRSPRFSKGGEDDNPVSSKTTVCLNELNKPVSRNVEIIGSVNEVVVSECGDKVGEEKLKGEVRGSIDVKGKKRKVDADDESNGVCRGWTREQEEALEKAYFAAQPTPHFWKKVARMVPGKSSQDCFDKVNSDQVTPLPRPPRSRTSKTKASSPALSASKLLSPNEAKRRRLGINKNRSQVAHKTLRAFLEKQCRVIDDNEADLFSILEPNVDPSIKATEASPQPSTPYHVQDNGCALLKSSQRISPILRNPLSSVNGLTSNVVSPPVLKQVKNKALHEKYIDVLRKREAKRNTLATKGGKVLAEKENKRECYMQNIDVRAAKNALVSNARDVISQLRSLRDNVTESTSDLDDDLHSEDDEGEDEA